MNKKLLTIIFLAAVVCGCQKEANGPVQGERGEATFSASLPGTKTYLSDKDGDVWHNYWAAGDAISVNGQSSNALTAGDGFVGTQKANFTISDFVSAANYCYAYPAGAVSGWNSGTQTATITIPVSQTYVAGQYDPAAFIMMGSGSSTTLSFASRMSLIRVTTTAPAEGTPKVSRVRIESLGSEKLSGAFTTDFSSLSGGDNGYVEMTPASAVDFGTDFTLAIPAQNYANGLRIIISADDGTSMTFSRKGAFNASAGTLYPVTAPQFVPSDITVDHLWVMSTSSVAIRWHGANATNDSHKEWRIHVYTDSACTSEEAAYTIPADAACWTEDQTPLTFIIGGLTQGTDYWFRVEDVANGVISDAVSGTTTAFTPVPMPGSDITSSSVGDVIFAEDFSEIKWGQSNQHSAAGFVPSDLSSFSNYSTDGATFINSESSAVVHFRRTDFNTAFTSSRLNNWLSESSLYIHPGFLKLGTTSNPGFILTPEFPIKDGEVAVVNVTVNAAKYDGSSADEWTVAVIKNPVTVKTAETRESDFAWMDISNPALYQEVTVSSTSWMDATAVGLELERGDRIVFGRARNGANSEGNARIYLNSIKVELVEFGSPQIAVSLLEKTSSTLSFTWNEGGSAETDNTFAYTAALYDNAACTGEPVQSYDFPANSAADIWRSDKFPKFIFSGLDQNTQYYLKVTDTTNGLESRVIPAKTSPFTVVEMPASITGTGVALAEDFSLFRWDFDYGQGCVGFSAPSTPSSYTELGSSYVKYTESVGAYQVFTSSAFASSRLNLWARDAGTDARVMVHPGCITLGSTSNNQKAWLLTPPFPVEDGKVATVTVKVTVRKGYGSATGDYAVGVLNNSSNNGANGGGANMKDANTSDFSWPDDRPSTVYNTFTVSNDSDWETKTYTGMQIHKDDRIVIGSRASYSYSSKKSCLSVSDITVTVTSLDDDE